MAPEAGIPIAQANRCRAFQALGDAMRSVRRVVEGVRLEAVRGRVMDAQVWSETHVKGSGSAIMVKGIGAGSSRTTSTVVNKREVCIETEDRVQIVEEFDAGKVTLMPGQDVTLIRAERGKEAMTVGVRNHSMRKSMLAGKDVFPGVTALLVASPFVTIAVLFVLFLIVPRIREPNETFLFVLFTMLAGNLYWFRGIAIRRAFRRRVERMMEAAEQERAQRNSGSVAA